ncbi:MAG: flagellar hook basal-body protein, partial [Holosporales bacterium]|nr:flagellar hook basal-body protein [Holosporales bacterium]
MDSGSIVALSQQKALYRAMEVVAQNLANANTIGYKTEKACFDSHIKSAGVKHNHAFVNERRIFRDFSEGPGQQTGNPLHIMIHGEGLFPIKAKSGVLYTRCGVFELNEHSEIVTPAGDPLLDQDDDPIVIPEGTQNIEITPDGLVAADQDPIAHLCVYRFERDQELMPEGHNLLSSQESPSVNEKVEFVQGM